MNDFYNNCKTCIPQFSDRYWWKKSQHRKYFGLFLFISALLSLVGTLYLVQARNEQYVSEVILEAHYIVKLIVVFVFLLLLQCLCFFLVRLLFHMHLKGYSRFFLFWIKIACLIVLFHLVLPRTLKQVIVFSTTYTLQMDVRETGYLEHEYHRMCKWILIYAFVLMCYCYSMEDKRHKRSVERNSLEAKRLSDKLLRYDLRQYLEKGFMIIVKKDTVLLINEEGELSIKGRKNDDLNIALKLDYTQISKSVFIVTTAILAVEEDHIEISSKRREILELALKKYNKLAAIAVEFKSEHGLLTLSPVYGDKLGKH